MSSLKRLLIFTLGLVAPLLAIPVVAPPVFAAEAPCADRAWQAEHEVFYKIFVRSFADSDGDRIGDFRGIEEHLPYLQSLGVTSILLTPIVPSAFYHNYFASRFDDVDPAFGTLATFRHLVQALHARGMKIYLDEEIQYVPEEHEWWKRSAGHPESEFSPFVLYNQPGNTAAEPGFGTGLISGYDGRQVRVAMVNLDAPQVHRYFADLFAHWVDPAGHGDFTQGVDGFRIDHMMDDLDDKGKLSNLMAGFWAPLIAHTKGINPQVTFIAEQADWKSYGEELQAAGGIDLVYAYPLRTAIATLNRDAIAAALAGTQAKTAAGKGQLIFVENHDTDRFASLVEGDPRRERLGAALVTLLKGSPLIYYGQELGMQGRQLHVMGGTDGNDIPVREAFRWSTKVADAGSAIWYRDSGPWWTNHYGHDADGISVAEQEHDPHSLLSYYRRLLRLRRSRAELSVGDQCLTDTDQPAVLAVRRRHGSAESLLLVNFSAEPLAVHLSASSLHGVRDGRKLRNLLGSGAGDAVDTGAVVEHGRLTARLAPYGLLLLPGSR